VALGRRWAEVLLQPLQWSVRCIVALDGIYVTAADRSADLLGRVVQRFPRHCISGQRSIVVLLRLLASLELFRRHVSHHDASVHCSRGVVLFRLDRCWLLLKLLEGRLVRGLGSPSTTGDAGSRYPFVGRPIFPSP
jgi:hypothetical protein